MKSLTFTFLSMVLIAAVTVAIETTDLPAKYQSLIERPPFGQVQGAADVAAPNWLANYVFCGLTQSNSGNGKVQAIISTKDNSHWYFRAEGETVDSDVTIQKIDLNPKATKVVLKKGLETGTLTFPERTTVPNAAPAAPAAPPPPGTPASAVPPTIRRIPFRRGN